MKNDQPIYILDFTSDHFVICLAKSNNISIIQATPFQLTLTQQMCENLIQLFSSLQFKSDAQSLTLYDFYRIMPMIAYEKKLMTYIWQLFFSNLMLTDTIDPGRQIYLIIPLEWEPHISKSLLEIVSQTIEHSQVTVLTDFFCIWFYQYIEDDTPAEIQPESNINKTYAYTVYQSNDHKVVSPLSDGESSQSVKKISCNVLKNKVVITPCVRGCHQFLIDHNIQPIVFDLHLSIGLLLNDHVFYPMCTSDISYGQYMHQSIEISRFRNGILMVMASLAHSMSPIFFLMKMEINYQHINQYRPLDIYLVQLNATQGHLYVSQKFSDEHRLVGEQLFSLPGLTR